MHYNIVNRKTGGVINRVRFADNEKDDDNLETRNKKRKKTAERLRDGWLTTTYKGTDLIIQEVRTHEDK